MTAMVSFDNDWTVFFTRPISAVVLGVSFASLAYPIIRAAMQRLRSPASKRVPRKAHP
jgi:putative tricarboxylic transport membrane protein